MTMKEITMTNTEMNQVGNSEIYLTYEEYL